MALPLIGPAIAGLSAVLARFLIPYIVIRILWALGVTVLTFVGVGIVTEYLQDTLRGILSGLPAKVFELVVLAGGFDAVEILLACMVAAIQIRQLRGSFRSINFFGGGQAT